MKQPTMPRTPLEKEMLAVLKQAEKVYGELRPGYGSSMDTLNVYRQMISVIAKAEGKG